MTREEILKKAMECTNGQRDQDYGKPEDNFGMIAELWSIYLRRTISSSDVAAMMILMKCARTSTGIYKADNWVDIAGYAACGGECQSTENG